MNRAHCEKENESNAKLAEDYRGISFLVFFPLCFISFGVERTDDSRLEVRIVPKTKAKELKAVDEDQFYDVTSSHAATSGDVDYDGKLGKCKMNGDGKKRKKRI